MTTLQPPTAGMKMATEQDTAARAVLLAQRRNLPIPEGVHERGRVLDAVRALSAESGVAPSTPDLTSVDAAKRAIRKVAAERAQATQVRGLAAEWLPLASSEWATAVTAAVSAWVPALVESFTAAWAAFRAAYAKAPDVDSSQLGSLTPEAFAAWKGAQDATRDLDLILADRVTCSTASPSGSSSGTPPGAAWPWRPTGPTRSRSPWRSPRPRTRPHSPTTGCNAQPP